MDDMAAYYPPPPPPPGSVDYTPHPQPPPPQPPPVVAPPPQHYLVQPYFPQQPPSFASYVAPRIPQPSYDELRTLFVAGLSEDVKPREIYNLFREFPGYESSHLRTPTGKSQPCAFAVFLDQQSAIGAMHALNGMVFDLEKGSKLYIDLAKSNSRSKRSRTDDERPSSDKRARSSSYSRGTPDSAGVGSIHVPGMGNSAYNMIGYPSAPSFNDRAVHKTIALNMNNSSAQHFPQNNTPCPTLFVANLGPTCTEQELIQVFSRCPGFIKLKMQSTYGAPVAFVDFQDTACSTGALSHLQGTFLYSSTTGEGMRLEYARSRMGMRKKPK
ncbi:U1 small nuclear ribonucleoprotein A-like isoform X3 [Malus sylvestris]|uniref:U1 small nuclear ribonucleoprotein A-like isoform X3 n=1 Tax=Malus sylvestris TaxID=3752 RepID=UPI0021AC6513|nr:U1 small nuclear ribonucleoprotein A-like isoform X3 [Malus sylvestris]